MHRIISLIPSATEIVYALGYGGQMVGRSHECDFPPLVQLLPTCTEPKFELADTSAIIDKNVRTILQEGLSVYRVNAAKLQELKPTHIITQSQCEECAVSLRDLQDAACELISSKPRIISLEPNCLEDIWKDIERVGTVLGAAEKADRLVENLQKRISAVERIAGYLNPVRVAFIEWVDPLLAAGCWMPELVHLAGGKNLFGEAKRHARKITWEELREADPDVIIVAPCGFSVMPTLERMHLLAKQPGYNQLSASIYEQVFVADGNHFFNRPGPRVADSLEMMAEMLHPESFDFGHESTEWVRYVPDHAS